MPSCSQSRVLSLRCSPSCPQTWVKPRPSGVPPLHFWLQAGAEQGTQRHTESAFVWLRGGSCPAAGCGLHISLSDGLPMIPCRGEMLLVWEVPTSGWGCFLPRIGPGRGPWRATPPSLVPWCLGSLGFTSRTCPFPHPTDVTGEGQCPFLLTYLPADCPDAP